MSLLDKIVMPFIMLRFVKFLTFAVIFLLFEMTQYLPLKTKFLWSTSKIDLTVCIYRIKS